MTRRSRADLLWIIDDDLDLRERTARLLAADFPAADVMAFETLYDASLAAGSPSVVLVDVGGVSGQYPLTAHVCARSIQSLAARHPGAVYLLNSAVNQWAAETANELAEMVPDAVVESISQALYVTIRDRIRDVLAAAPTAPGGAG